MKKFLLCLILTTLVLSSACKNPAEAREQSQARLNRIYPGQFEVYDSSSTLLKINLNFNRFYVWVRSRRDKDFQTKFLWNIKNPEGGRSDRDIKRMFARAYWRLVHSRRLAEELREILNDFSIYVLPLSHEWEKIPVDLAFDQAWRHVMPGADVSVRLFLYRDVNEQNRISIERDVHRALTFLERRTGRNTKLALSFLPPDASRKYDELIYPYLSYSGGKRWEQRHVSFSLVRTLKKFPRDFWGDLSMRLISNTGKDCAKRIRARARREAPGRGKFLLKTSFVGLKLNKQNIDRVDFEVPICRINFEKHCPRPRRGYWSGRLERTTGMITFD